MGRTPRTHASSTSPSGSLATGGRWSTCGGRGYREDADEGDPGRMLALPQSVVGYPQLYLLDPDRHLIEINAERLDD